MPVHLAIPPFFAFVVALAVLLLSSCPTQATEYGNAFTVYTALSVKDYKCLRSHASVPVIRVYAGGKVDPNGLSNIQNAKSAGFAAMEVYVQPDPFSSKPGWQQFDESYEHVNKQFSLQRIWLLVTDPRTWHSNPDANTNFMRSFVQEANAKGVAVGIYTSWYDWLLIAKDYQGLQQYCGGAGGCQLWYWHTLGQGPTAASNPDFGDFRQFGSFKSPLVKEYDIADNRVCSANLNWSVYSENSAKRGQEVGKDEAMKDRNRTNPKMKAKMAQFARGTKRDGTAEEASEKAAKMIIGNAF